MLWVFKRDPALNNAQGFVDVPDVLADRLIQEGKAAAQYDLTLEREPEQPGDGEEPTVRVAKAKARQEATEAGRETDAPQDAAQGDSEAMENGMRRGPGRPRKA